MGWCHYGLISYCVSTRWCYFIFMNVKFKILHALYTGINVI
jgi:hypothetical protein